MFTETPSLSGGCATAQRFIILLKIYYWSYNEKQKAFKIFAALRAALFHIMAYKSTDNSWTSFSEVPPELLHQRNPIISYLSVIKSWRCGMSLNMNLVECCFIGTNQLSLFPSSTWLETWSTPLPRSFPPVRMRDLVITTALTARRSHVWVQCQAFI